MEKGSRTEKVIFNSAIAMACQIVGIIVSFSCRTVFSVLLGTEYLGINGLFANILTVLSFADLGIGNALVYRMYAPLAAGDQNRLRLFFGLYRKLYLVIMVVVSVLGLAVMPFLQYLVTAPDVAEDLRILYLLYLSDTVITYALAYKKSILIADQKNYIISLIEQLFNIIMNIVQIIVLLLTHNFILYCLIKILCNLGINLACAGYVSRKYPYLKEKSIGTLARGDIRGLKQDAMGLLLTKISNVTFGGIDNLFISAFIGIDLVGVLSNYTLILTVINGLMNRMISSSTASIGNLAVTDDISKTKAVLKKIFFLNSALYGYISIGMILLLGQFMSEIWLSAAYLLPLTVVFTVVLELFLRSIHYPLYTVQVAMGLFSQKKFYYVLASVLNICLNFLLVRPLGITGLYIATILSRGITYVVDIFVVYKYGFKESSWDYYQMLIEWLLFWGICLVLLFLIVNQLAWSGIMGFIGKILVITAIYAVFFFAVFSRTEEYRCYVGLMHSIAAKLKTRFKKQ